MAWPVTDFDGALFNNGNGADELKAIHLAIKERADATQHSLKDGDYSAVFPSLTIWLSDPVSGDGKVYLKDTLEQFHTDIQSLIEDDADIIWYELDDGVDAWTMSSLTTDIGMGAFADLLTKPANPDPFIWLHAALDRLIYPRVTAVFTGSSENIGREYGSHFYSTIEVAWDNRYEQGPITTGWDAGDDHRIRIILSSILLPPNEQWATGIFENSTVTFDTSPYDGTVVFGTYRFTHARNIYAGDVDIKIGTSTDTLTSSDTSGTLELTTSDFVVSADTSVEFEFTNLPSTCPFSTTMEEVSAILLPSYVYLNLTSILTDQA